MKVVELGDLIRNKIKSLDPKKSPYEEFALCSISAFDKGEPEYVKGSEIGSSKKLLKKGDVVISRIVPHIKRVWVIPNINDRKVLGSGEWIVFNSEKIDADYLKFFLLSDFFHRKFMQTVKGVGGSLLRADPKQTGKIQIPLPPLATQQKIAAALDKADAIRKRSQLILAKYDQLAQSVFLEMFGDPVKNEKGWEVKPLGRHISVQGGYAFKSSHYCNDGVRLVKISNVHFEVLNWSDDINFVPVDFHKKHNNYALKEGDILIALTRPIIKSLNTVKTAIVRSNDLPSLLNQRVARFNVDENRINKKFLISFLYTDHFKMLVENLMPVNLQPNISTGQIESIALFLPPIDLQHQFATIIAQIEKQKAQTQLELDRAEELYQSLLQRAFSGELFPETSPKELILT